MKAPTLPPGGGSYIRDSEDGEWRPNVPQPDLAEDQAETSAPTKPAKTAATKEPQK